MKCHTKIPNPFNLPMKNRSTPDTRFAYRVIIPYPRVCPLLGRFPRSHRRCDLWRRFSFPFNLRFRIEFLYSEPYTIYSSLLHDICCSMFQHFKLFQVRITFFYICWYLRIKNMKFDIYYVFNIKFKQNFVDINLYRV